MKKYKLTFTKKETDSKMAGQFAVTKKEMICAAALKCSLDGTEWRSCRCARDTKVECESYCPFFEIEGNNVVLSCMPDTKIIKIEKL